MTKHIKSLDDFLALLEGVKKTRDGYEALCPGHDDHDRSLSVKEADRKILVYCHADCQLQDILKVLGLKVADLFLGEKSMKPGKRGEKAEVRQREIEAVYDYVDAAGKPFQVVRTKPKGFFQRQPDGKGGWKYDVEGITPTLYQREDIDIAITLGEYIFVVEGEKDVERLRSLGLAATCNPGGAGKWRDSYSEVLASSDLVIVPDSDKVGRDHARKVATSCHGKARSIKLLELANAKDVTDWLEQGHTAEELRQLVDGCSEYEPSPEEPVTTRELPQVVCNNRQLRDKTGDALHILYEHNKAEPEMFQRGGSLVRVSLDERHNPYIELLGENALRGILTRVADFINIRADAKGETIITSVSPPLDVVNDILSLNSWKFPSLLAITSTPVIRKDGSIVTKHGYDAETGFYYHGDTNIPDIPESPTKDDVEHAVALIKEVLWDFPFDSVGSRANAVAALITPVVRPLIDDLVPLAVFDKPQQGTGATILCHTAAVIATGTEGGTMGGHRNDEEWRKNITSTLLKGYTVVIVDNVDGELYSPSLAAALTTPIWKDRVLGHSEDALIPNTVCWLANGNNIKLKGDLPRRAYRVRLDAQEAQPWLRPPETFLHPYLIRWLKERRGEILGAILTVARAWVVAGKPTPQAPIIIGSFPRWCEVIGGILEYAGIAGFLTNLQEMYVSMDAETPAWEIFLELWHQTFGAKEVRLAEVISLAKDDSGFAYYMPDGLGNVEDKGFSRKLGKALSRREGVRFSNGYIIEKGEGKKHGIGWIVKPAGPKTGDYSFKHETPQNHPDFVAKREFGESTIPPACNEKDENNINVEEGADKLPKLPSNYENGANLGSLPLEAPEKARDPRTDGLVEFWDSLGRPIIHLGPGENSEDLKKLLSDRNILPRHLEAVKSWAVENGWKPPIESGEIVKERSDRFTEDGEVDISFLER